MTNFTNIHHHEGFWTSYLKQSLTCLVFSFPQPTLVTHSFFFFLFWFLFPFSALVELDANMVQPDSIGSQGGRTQTPHRQTSVYLIS